MSNSVAYPQYDVSADGWRFVVAEPIGAPPNRPSSSSRTGTKSTATASRTKFHETNQIEALSRISVGMSPSRYLTAVRGPSMVRRRGKTPVKRLRQCCGRRPITVGNKPCHAPGRGKTHSPPPLRSRSGSRVQCVACLPSLIHCSGMPRTRTIGTRPDAADFAAG